VARKIGLAVATLVVVFGIAEVGFRLYDARSRRTVLDGRNPEQLITQPADDGRIFALRPNRPGLTNSHGFRDRERKLEKDAGVFRIAVIGDSVTMQASLSFEDLYVTRLQSKINSAVPDHDIEILNFGVTGYGTLQEVALLREVVVKFEPDALLWQFHLNDAIDPRVDGGDGGLGRYYSRPQSAFFSYLHRRWERLRRSRTIRARGLDHIPEDLQHQVFRWDKISNAFQEVAKLVDDNEIATWVFVYPTWPDTSWDEYTPDGFAVVNDLVARFEGLGFETLDLVAVFRREAPSRHRMADDDPWHPNVAGHQFIADELAQWLAPMVPPR
jgi:lysophospholipase L1-like esterase